MSRRDQLAVKKRKREEGNPRFKAKAKAKQVPKKKPGRKPMKKPAAAKPAVEAPEEAEEEEPEDDEEIEEGANSSSSKNGLKRAKPLDDDADDEEEKESPPKKSKQPKAKAKGAAKAKAKPNPKPSGSSAPSDHDGDQHASLRTEIHDCLRCCEEHDSTGKHQHDVASLLHDNAQLSTYWTRGAVGVKVRESVSEAWKQVAYFSRQTPCVGTNCIIAKKWVYISV